MNKDKIECGLSSELLKERQNYTLNGKIWLSKQRIVDWYNYWNGNVYVSYSGGKDSTVLLHIVRSLYPNIPGVFIDTGLEYPEIRSFVKTIGNIIWIKPKMTFTQAIEKYGYPVISKENSNKLYEIRNTNSKKLLNLRLNGRGDRYHSGKLPQKYQYLIEAPFKISSKCCDILKKNPAKQFEKKYNLKPFIGTMISDSKLRRTTYIRYGCNAFNNKRPVSTPLSFFSVNNIWEYINRYSLKYCSIYDTGVKNTGCVFCMFGLHLQKEPNKFQILKKTHPKLYSYCVDKIGLGEILTFMGIKH